MRIMDTIRRWVGSRVSNQAPAPQITRNSSTWGDLVMAIDGLPVLNDREAMTVSAITSCVNLIGGTISALPLHVYSRDRAGIRDRRFDDPLWWVLNEEWSPRWSAAAGWEYLVKSRLLHGDGYARILRNSVGQPTGLLPIHPTRVFITPSPDGMRLIYSIDPDPTVPVDKGNGYRGRLVVDQDDMIHISGDGFDGCKSLSPLSYHLRMTGAVAHATQEFSARFFAEGARPDYALVSAGNMSPEYIESLRAQIDERHGGYRKSHRPMLLQGGMTIEKLGMPLEELQLIATRQFQIEEIARVFGVPPFMIGHTEKTSSWGTGVGAMGQNFRTFTLAPHLTKIHNEFNRKLFRTYSRVVEFDTFELERADMKSMFEAFRTALGRAGEPGFLTTNEVRAYLNLAPKEGGDGLTKGMSDAQADAPATEEPAPGEQGPREGPPG